MKLKRKLLIKIMINILLHKNLTNQQQKILFQDQHTEILQPKMVSLLS